MSNLAGTTWLFKDAPSLTSCGCSATGNLFFTEINNNISILVNSSTISYTTITDEEELVYDTSLDGWQDNTLKIISFISEPTTFTPNENTFITWLEANATKQEKTLIDVVGAKILYDDLRTRIDDNIYDPILLKTTLEVPKNNYNSLSKVFCIFPALESPLTYEHCYVASYYMSNPTVFAEDPVVKFSGSRFVLEVTLKALAPASTVDITLCKQEAATIDMTLNSGVQYAPLNSPTFTGTPNAPTAAAGTNNTQIATTAFVQNAFATNDAMVYKGVITQFTDLPTTPSRGWTYKVSTAFTYDNIKYGIGDMFICNTDTPSSSRNIADWDVVQSNIDTVDGLYSNSLTVGTRKTNSNIGIGSFASGSSVEASSSYTHAEGNDTIASQPNAHAEGFATKATKNSAHAEGFYSVADGPNGHAEGFHAYVSAQAAHAEGNRTCAAGTNSHAQGLNSVTYTTEGTVLGRNNLPGSSNNIPNWQSNTIYYSNRCVKQNNTVWLCKTEHTSGTDFDSSKWIEIPNNTTDYAEIVGGGASISERANVRTLDFNGNEVLAGGLTATSLTSSQGSITIGSTTVTESFFSNPSLAVPITNEEIDLLFADVVQS